MSRHKNWMVGDARWNPRMRQRVEEQFRRHVRTPRANPDGRIERQPCPFCVRELFRSDCHDMIHIVEAAAFKSQFHHLDYNNPYLGVWCCNSHHRRIEHGSVTIYKRDIWDYSSVVAPLIRSKHWDILEELTKEKS